MPNDTEGSEDNVLKGQEALELWRQGKTAWNDWADGHKGWEVDFSAVQFTPNHDQEINFAGYRFPGLVDFRNARFCEKSNFKDAKFLGFANFHLATFAGEALFYGASFNEDAYFHTSTFSDWAFFAQTDFKRRAYFNFSSFLDWAAFMDAEFGGIANFVNVKFVDQAEFLGAKFRGAANFDLSSFESALVIEDAEFREAPDFRSTSFTKHVSLRGTKVRYKRSGLLFRSESGKDADKFRRLKQLAKKAEDHDLEQKFFSCELKAKRYWETKNPLVLFFSYLYAWSSNYGRSVLAPITWLVVAWWIFGALYLVRSHSWKGVFLEALQAFDANAAWFSFAQVVPFFGASKSIADNAAKALFCGKDNIDTVVRILMLSESALSFVFIFLIGLALRNRFRIR